HHDIAGFREHHAQARARDLVDAVALGPRRLLELQAAELDVQFVARGLELGQAVEELPVLVAREHHRDRGGHVGQDQQREQQPQGHAASASFSATRSTALRARGLRASSASPALVAPPMARSVGVNATASGRRRLAGGALARAAMNCLVIRSSSEWKLITASRPPAFSRATAASRPASRSSSSRLMKIRIAWKLRVAGWILSLPRGITDAISSASCAVRVIGSRARAATIARAIRRDCRSSPYCHSTSAISAAPA